MLTLLTIYIISKDKQANRYFSYYSKIKNNEKLKEKVTSIKLIDENIIRYFFG